MAGAQIDLGKHHSNLVQIGIAVSPTQVDEFMFRLFPNQRNIWKGCYCAYPHPLNDALCLARIYRGQTLDPELSPLGIGTTLIVLKNYHFENESRAVIMHAEVLGYMENGRFKRPDFPPATGAPVYAVTGDQIKQFYKSSNGIQIPVGIDPYSGVNIELCLDAITKGHMAVCGITRSGKTTFVLNLIRNGALRGARFLIFDRYGEYALALEKLRGLDLRIIAGDQLKSVLDLGGKEIAENILGFPSRSKLGQIVGEIFDELKFELATNGAQDFKLKFLEKFCQIASSKLRTDADRQRYLEQLNRGLELHRDELISFFKPRPSILEEMLKHQIVVIDISSNDVIEQQMIVASVLRELSREAIRTRGQKFTGILVFEEMQYYAPERNMVSFGDPYGTGCYEALVTGLSQLGGFNLGFLVITQRPAYVSKAILAQCNTYAIFRLMSSADHDQISSVTGYPKHRVSELISGLRDHMGLLIGMGSPFEFPSFIETSPRDRIYPVKSTLTPSQVLERMRSRVD